MGRVELFSRQQNVTGEGPLWSASRQQLFWVDIGGKAIFAKSLSAADADHWPLPHHPGCLAELADGRLAVAMGDGVHAIDLESGETAPLLEVPDLATGVRFNDGKVDPRGRLWLGTMQNNFGPAGEAIAIERRDGVLYRIDAEGQAAVVERDVGIANTLAWSPDETRFYFADSMDNRIYAYDYEADSGEVSGKGVLFEEDGLGLPDGSAIDVDGCLWNARWDGGVVLRITPDGRIDRRIEVPVPRPTSCIFGGPNLDLLFITSARGGLDAGALAEAPLSGSVCAVAGIAQGLPVPPYAWSGR